MKVYLGPYKSDLIPVYSWERKYEHWRRPETFYLPEEEYTKYDKIVFGLFRKLSNLVRPLNRWSNNRDRKIKVHIDHYDVWSADHTLAMIIAPTLKKLKEIQHGMPSVDNEDVPEKLKMERNDPSEWSDEKDKLLQARWNYVLDEMIWAFEQHASEDDTDQFYHNVNQLEMLFTPLENKSVGSISFNYQKDSSKPGYWVDEEGMKKHNERKKNGRRLFAKYYEALWD